MSPWPCRPRSPAQLVRFVQEAAAHTGLNRRALLALRLEGELAGAWWSVAAFPTARPGDTASASLGAHGRFARKSLTLVGFLSPPAKRRGRASLHLHARPGSQPFVAHVDSLRPGAGLRLLLPALPQ